MQIIEDEIMNGLNTAYIDSNYNSNLAYRPEFVSNDYKSGKKVLSTIEDELRRCDEFSISVAFITSGGITPLLQVLEELEQRQVPGKILTTDYLMFTEPEALKKISQLTNIELRMFCTNGEREGFHTKGYIFREKDVYRIIIGSSNMTGNAITVNREWNTKLVSTTKGAVAKNIVDEFNMFWNSEKSKDIAEIIEEYETRYRIIKEQKRIAKAEKITNIQQYRLEPNKMQTEFVRNVIELKNNGENRALLLSATGTGKTYAAAFALREFQSRRTLFLVHREQIAKKSMESFERVLGSGKTFGVLSGNSKDYEADCLFSTIQTMSRDENLSKFNPTAFDTIIVDEVHRAGANTYLKIMEYFNPNFLLGMTASPERTDGFDIYQLFNHNIAYEIRLQQALEEDMLCPFHYFGITELEIDGEVADDSSKLKQFAMLTSDTRVDYIVQKAKYYGHSGNRVKGLVFCSRKTEARELSMKFNKRGFRTTFLSGDDSQEQRELAIEQLTDDSRDDYIDYIFTVDIFNEGVDIPEINQVIMLRPTESPIVFVQQLGRGLRKSEDKEYVVILDFIGNYNNNYMIPIALSGDRTYNKDNVRRYVREGERIIPGESTIHFDEISRKRIYQSIDSANFSDIKLIKESYFQLKYKLGKIPSLKDFDEYGEMDVLRIFDNGTLGSYHKFLSKYEKEYNVRLTTVEEKYLEFISKKLASGKRVHELELIKRCVLYSAGVLEKWGEKLKLSYDIDISQKTITNVVNVLTNEFPSGSGKKTYADCVFLEQADSGNEYQASQDFIRLLRNAEFKDAVMELVDFGIMRSRRDYANLYQDTNFELYQKYTYEDVCRLLEWENNEVPLNIGGYKLDKKTKTFPVFINYHKGEEISDTINYEDRFVSNNRLIAISKGSRTVQSEDVQNFLYAKERDIDMQLFVRKNKDDKISKEFYYLGRMQASGQVNQFVMRNTDKTAVEIEWILETPVREDLYKYIVSE